MIQLGQVYEYTGPEACDLPLNGHRWKVVQVQGGRAVCLSLLTGNTLVGWVEMMFPSDHYRLVEDPTETGPDLEVDVDGPSELASGLADASNQRERCVPSADDIEFAELQTELAQAQSRIRILEDDKAAWKRLVDEKQALLNGTEAELERRAEVTAAALAERDELQAKVERLEMGIVHQITNFKFTVFHRKDDERWRDVIKRLAQYRDNDVAQLKALLEPEKATPSNDEETPCH